MERYREVLVASMPRQEDGRVWHVKGRHGGREAAKGLGDRDMLLCADCKGH